MPDPGGILGEIVARKRLDVATRFAADDPRDRAQPTQRSLHAALVRPGARFIMEVKRASPSQGALRPAADPAAIARAYRGAADAISVLTDAPYFGGSLEDMAAVREAYDGPILAKDFIVDLRQVAEARLFGADAILVILSVLGDAEAGAVMAEAERLGMDALVEAHDEAEVGRAVALGARLIGINNRNLSTLAVDLGVTERLSALVPADRLVVSESGISDRADVERLGRHADAFLVGTSLMRADDPAQAARALAFGRVKVCGLTRAQDVRDAAAAGAFYAGFVFVPNTPRAVTLPAAADLAEAAQASGTATVGVFRNEKVAQVASAARSLGLNAVQLHGEEDAAYIAGLRNFLPDGCELWAAGAVGDDVPEPRQGADRTLFDTAVGGRSGGTGSRFDWRKLEGRKELGLSLLAGGLTAETARAASRVGAYALDIGSGIEATPGRKDPAKLRAFFDALRVPARSDEEQACA